MCGAADNSAAQMSLTLTLPRRFTLTRSCGAPSPATVTLTRAGGRGLSRNKAGEASNKWLRPRHPDSVEAHNKWLRARHPDLGEGIRSIASREALDFGGLRSR
jgi:hypothetical protein